MRPAPLAYDKPLCASLDGFTLHAATRAAAFDVAGKEALLRYVLRPPLAQERVEHRPDGLVRIALARAFAEGTVAVEMDPLSLLCRLAAAVPPPRYHTVKYAGVLASASPWRRRIAPRPQPVVADGCSACTRRRSTSRALRRRQRAAPTPTAPGPTFYGAPLRSFDVTPMVARAVLRGEPLNLALYGADTTANTGKYFVSSEGGCVPAYHPLLRVLHGKAKDATKLPNADSCTLGVAAKVFDPPGTGSPDAPVDPGPGPGGFRASRARADRDGRRPRRAAAVRARDRTRRFLAAGPRRRRLSEASRTSCSPYDAGGRLDAARYSRDVRSPGLERSRGGGSDVRGSAPSLW